MAKVMRKIRRTRAAQLSRDAQDPMLAMHADAVFQNQNIAAACNPRSGTSNGVRSFHIVYLLP
jgi:hypothetical protein